MKYLQEVELKSNKDKYKIGVFFSEIVVLAVLLTLDIVNMERKGIIHGNIFDNLIHGLVFLLILSFYF